MVKNKYHKCSVGRWCKNCKRNVEMNHVCFILTEQERSDQVKSKNKRKFNGYIYFDFECMATANGHVPNLVIADKVCIECVDIWPSKKQCSNGCGIYSFKNND